MDRQQRLSRLVGITRVALASQVVAILLAIALSSPGLIDRILRPTICANCFDFRGLDFVLWVVVFLPVGVALTAATLPLRPGRIWPAFLALVVDVAVLGFVGYSLLLDITGQSGTNTTAPPVAVQVVQGMLVLVPNLVSLALVLRLLYAAYGSSHNEIVSSTSSS